MTRTLSAADYSAAVSAEFHRLAVILRGCREDLAWFRDQIKRGVKPEHNADRIRWTEGCRDVHLAQMGELLVRHEDVEEGDRLIVGADLFEFSATGASMRVKVAGRWEDTDAFVARYVGDAPLPGHDDEPLPSEVAEWQHDYARAV